MSVDKVRQNRERGWLLEAFLAMVEENIGESEFVEGL